MANLAALRAAVFSLSVQNCTGRGVEINPPPVRGLKTSFDISLTIGTYNRVRSLYNDSVAINLHILMFYDFLA